MMTIDVEGFTGKTVIRAIRHCYVHPVKDESSAAVPFLPFLSAVSLDARPQTRVEAIHLVRHTFSSVLSDRLKAFRDKQIWNLLCMRKFRPVSQIYIAKYRQ